jgi:hypothetical protein
VSLQRPSSDTPTIAKQENLGDDAIVHAHYFVGSCDWWVTEYDPDDDLAFGFVNLGDPGNAELGYISLAELEAVRAPIRLNGRRLDAVLPVEFDAYWEPVTIGEIKRKVQGART